MVEKRKLAELSSLNDDDIINNIDDKSRVKVTTTTSSAAGITIIDNNVFHVNVGQNFMLTAMEMTLI